MAGAKKAKHAGEKAKGKVKETVGTVTGNNRLKAEGKAELKQRGEKAKDAARKVTR